jgi:hypothetical protein
MGQPPTDLVIIMIAVRNTPDWALCGAFFRGTCFVWFGTFFVFLEKKLTHFGTHCFEVS